MFLKTLVSKFRSKTQRLPISRRGKVLRMDYKALSSPSPKDSVTCCCCYTFPPQGLSTRWHAHTLVNYMAPSLISVGLLLSRCNFSTRPSLITCLKLQPPFSSFSLIVFLPINMIYLQLTPEQREVSGTDPFHRKSTHCYLCLKNKETDSTQRQEAETVWIELTQILVLMIPHIVISN